MHSFAVMNHLLLPPSKASVSGRLPAWCKEARPEFLEALELRSDDPRIAFDEQGRAWSRSRAALREFSAAQNVKGWDVSLFEERGRGEALNCPWVVCAPANPDVTRFSFLASYTSAKVGGAKCYSWRR